MALIYGEKGYNPSIHIKRPYECIRYAHRSISDVEREILENCPTFDTESISTYLTELEKARIKWACISSKTQREEKKLYEFTVYENLTTIKHHYSHINGNKPPSREGSPVQSFSRKSRYRMMKKIKTMKRSGLNLPYFITLTYGHNMMDFKQAKKQLNVFFQRFRRVGEFRYMWKMEPQERGAIHFHLMIFPSDNLFPECWKEEKLEYLRLYISSIWNKISGQAFQQYFKRFGEGKFYGIPSLYAGTQCDKVKNWYEATGYLSKYMAKNEVKGENWKDFNTGRFWGFSNNFDFKPYFSSCIDQSEIDKMEVILKEICEASFEDFKQYAKLRLKYLNKIKHKKPDIYKMGVEKLLNQMKKQKRRYIINKEKIELGANVQAQVNYQVAKEIIPEFEYW